MATVTVRVGDAQTQVAYLVRQRGVLFGASTSDNTKWAEFTRPQPDGVGPLPIRRSYDGPNLSGVGPSGIPTTFAQSRAAPDVAAGRISLHTMKPASVPTAAAGGYNEALATFYGSITHEDVEGIWHEPEDQVAAGAFTIAQWQQANIQAATVLREQDKPNVRFSICLRGPRTILTYGGLEQYWHPAFDDLVDVILLDPYRDGVDNFASYMAPTMAWTRSKGKPVILAEFGVLNTASDATRAGWITKVGTWADAQADVEAILYFQNMQSFVNDGTQAFASLQALAATHV